MTNTKTKLSFLKPINRFKKKQFQQTNNGGVVKKDPNSQCYKNMMKDLELQLYELEGEKFRLQHSAFRPQIHTKFGSTVASMNKKQNESTKLQLGLKEVLNKQNTLKSSMNKTQMILKEKMNLNESEQLNNNNYNFGNKKIKDSLFMNFLSENENENENEKQKQNKKQNKKENEEENNRFENITDSSEKQPDLFLTSMKLKLNKVNKLNKQIEQLKNNSKQQKFKTLIEKEQEKFKSQTKKTNNLKKELEESKKKLCAFQNEENNIKNEANEESNVEKSNLLKELKALELKMQKKNFEITQIRRKKKTRMTTKRRVHEYKTQYKNEIKEKNYLLEQISEANDFIQQSEKSTSIFSDFSDRVDISCSGNESASSSFYESFHQENSVSNNNDNNTRPLYNNFQTYKRTVSQPLVKINKLKNSQSTLSFDRLNSRMSSVTINSKNLPKFESKNNLDLQDYQRWLISDSTKINNNESNYSNSKNMRTFRKKIHIKKNINKRIEITSLEMLLRTPHGVAYFTDFLREQLNQENILFFQAVKEFKQNCQNIKQIIKKGKEIFKKYIKPGALFEINIISYLRKEIIGKAQNSSFDREMFDKAQAIVYDHMEYNSWVPFCESKYYKALIARLRKKSKGDFNTKTRKCKLISFSTLEKSKCLNEEYNCKPTKKTASLISQDLLSNLIQIIKSFHSVSTQEINFRLIKQSIPFSKFVKSTARLQSAKVNTLDEKELLCLFINLYNLISLHSLILNGFPKDKVSVKKFLKNSKYSVGGLNYSLHEIYHGILRANKLKTGNKPYFANCDPKRQYSLHQSYPRIHFSLINFSFITQIQVCNTENIAKSLEKNAQNTISNLVKIKANKIYLPFLFHTFLKDFGGKDSLLNWILMNSKKDLLFEKKNITTFKYIKRDIKVPRIFLKNN
ncbi:electron carrier/ protein disulfide oxidoreductase [Anaeramoeba flamelloides]|uniref:Electron carrier/ protein disulfide oxidoreductase n=1 Tax=Anaeramoeba flamelloides TaxID=1746091 RepID=A0AAV7Y235_9EUKA|nr:electron carrier/ protein disulfide oxidoreductase [Anaeramoeba flamelloides]